MQSYELTNGGRSTSERVESVAQSTSTPTNRMSLPNIASNITSNLDTLSGESGTTSTKKFRKKSFFFDNQSPVGDDDDENSDDEKERGSVKNSPTSTVYGLNPLKNNGLNVEECGGLQMLRITDQLKVKEQHSYRYCTMLFYTIL